MTTIHSYSAETAKTGMFHHAFRVGRYPRTLIERHSLLWNFFRRDLLGRFRGSALGIFWVLIQPIFLFFVYFMIFGILFAPKDELEATGPDPAFALYLFAGIISFSAINEGTLSALGSVLGNANLVKKVRFPCELLPLVPILVANVVYAVGCVVLVIAGLIVGEVHIGLNILWWPVFILIQLGFSTGLGLLLAGANVFVRDIGHLYRVFSQAWFFLTPIFWRLDMVQGAMSAVGMPWFAKVLMMNPTFSIVLAQRQIFGIGDGWDAAIYAETFPHTLPTNLAVGGAWAVALLFLGYGFFQSRRHKFADLV